MKPDGRYISVGFIWTRPSESKEAHHPGRSLEIKLQMSSRLREAYIASLDSSNKVQPEIYAYQLLLNGLLPIIDDQSPGINIENNTVT